MKQRQLILLVPTLILSAALFSCTKSSLNEPDLSDNGASLLTVSDRGTEGKIVFTQVVQLEGSQEVPAVNTETKGIAILRVSDARILYSKVIVQKLAEGDALRFSHIHRAPTGVNGPVIINLTDNAAEFGVNKETQLTEAQYQSILNDQIYVNVHSNFSPSGIIRGQIR